MSDQNMLMWIEQKIKGHGLRGLAGLWEMNQGHAA